MTGWIKLNRSLAGHWLWEDKPFSQGQAWIDILFMVNHEDRKIPLDGSMFEVKRGMTVTSIRTLSERWGWSRSKVTRFLDLLENEKMITQKRDSKKTVLTVDKYGFYQGVQSTDEPPKSHQKATDEPVTNTNKNVKNDNNYLFNIPPLTLKLILERAKLDNLAIEEERESYRKAITGLWSAQSRTIDHTTIPGEKIKAYLVRITYDDVAAVHDAKDFFKLASPVAYLKTAILRQLIDNYPEVQQ